jgi:threonine dehydrogenase-like Zn-dependent dehydrogenase
MRAVAVKPGTKDSLHIRHDVPEPNPKPYEAVVRVHSGGICATDLDLHQGSIGRAPADSDYLVIGHENLGKVEHAPRGSKVREGDLVVSTLRRACGDYCRPCLTGEQDMCVTGNFEERGIVGLHGFLSEAYTEDTFYLVKVPPQLRETATLAEPLSILEKGIDHAMRIQSRFSWEPKKALVMGAGPVGILGAAALRMRGYEVIVASLEEEGGRKDRLLAEAGIRYLCIKTTPITEVTRGADAQDIVIDASGSEMAVPSAIEALAQGGICILASVTRGSRPITVDIATVNRNIVLGNRVILGTVKAGRRHFEMAVRDLETIELRRPGWLANLITRRLPFEQALTAMTRAPEEIKTVLTFA